MSDAPSVPVCSPSALAKIIRGPNAGLVGVVIATDSRGYLRVQVTPTYATWVGRLECEVME